MPSTNDYFQNLKLQAEAAALAKKQALDTAYEMATQANVNPTTGEITYNKDASGAEKLGTADVAYKEKQRSTAASGESAGMLRSGQQARQKLVDESDYRARILSLAQDKTAQQTQIDKDTATQVAEYRALYGTTGGASNSSAPTTPRTPSSSNFDPITKLPEETATQKPVVYSPAAVAQIKKAYATPTRVVPKASPTTTVAPKKSPTTTVAPKKSVVPKRIGGL
jgi:hypothetical protein